MNLKSKISRPLLISLTIFSLALILRIYNLHNLFVFTIDEEYLFTQAQTIVKDFHLIWIGLSVSVGFYMGPMMTYITALLIFLFKDPLSGGYLAAIIGSITAMLIALIAKDIFNNKAGLIAGLLYAVLPLIVFYDQRFWNNTLVPIISLLLFYSLYKAVKNPKWWVLFGFLSGLIFHTNLTLFPYILIGFVFFLRNIRRISFKILAISIGAFIIVYSPLLIFDYFHNWSNITSPFRFKSDSVYKNESIQVDKHFRALFNFLGRFYYLNIGGTNVDENHWGCTSVSGNNVPAYRDKYSTYTNPPLLTSLISLLLIVIFILSKKTWQSLSRKILALIIVLTYGFFLIFPGGALEYYLLPIFPLLVFIPAILISDMKGRIKTLFLGLMAGVLLYSIVVVLNSNPQLGIGSQKRIIENVMNVVKDEPFELHEMGECRGFAGWRYLFTSYGRVPVKSSIDSIFGWLYPEEINKNLSSKYTVIVFEKRAIEIKKPVNSVAEFEEGGFKAYVISK